MQTSGTVGTGSGRSGDVMVANENIERGITLNECDAIRLLARDGWTPGELKMTFHVSNTHSVRHHAFGDCVHNNTIRPVTEWNNHQ